MARGTEGTQKEIKGQMTVFDFPELMPEKKMAENCCKTCMWFDEGKEECAWILYKPKETKYQIGNCDEWAPNTNKFKCCQTCKWSNDFEYEGEDQNNPIDEPNIYCTHSEGSENRHCRWPNSVVKHFGVGLWDRQHEYDLCDRYELDKEWNKDCEEL